MRILVIDDQKTTGMALSGTLANLGHEPHLMTSSVEALECINRGDWRLVITDWMMPEMDGPEVCRRIRAVKRNPYTYIIMVTSRTDRLDRLEGLSAGADDFLSKPVDEEELIVRLAIAGRILDVQAELEEKNARLQEMANLDPLTGLANRRRLAQGIDAVSSGADVCVPLSVLAIDVDHFKSYNDEFGHLAGDDVLRMVAATLTANTRAGDLVVRFGGEEFVVLLPAVDAQVAVQIAEELRAAIESQTSPLRLVTASFGIATAKNSTEIADIKGLLATADGALYYSKESGRNRVTHASSIDRNATLPSIEVRESNAASDSDSRAATPSSACAEARCP